MKISTDHQNMYNTPIQYLHYSNRIVPLSKSMDINQHEYQNKNIVKSKSLGNCQRLGEERLFEMILFQTIKKANKALLKPPTELRISIHEKTKQICIKIINTENQEVIREITSEKALDAAVRMWELAGLFVDKKA